jgi:hypothetical protein
MDHIIQSDSPLSDGCNITLQAYQAIEFTGDAILDSTGAIIKD